LSSDDQDELHRLLKHGDNRPAPVVAAIRELYAGAGVFRIAGEMVRHHRRQALAAAQSITSPAFGLLLTHLVDKVLDRRKWGKM
jgi:hypothetical protein